MTTLLQRGTPAAPAGSTRFRLRILGGLLLVVMALAGLVGVRLVLAKQHLSSAQTALVEAKRDLEARNLDRAEADIRRAGAQTRAARGLVGDPIAVVFAHVPLLGRPLTVARGLTFAADDLARGVLPRAEQSMKALEPNTLRSPDGTINLAEIEGASPSMQVADAQQVRIQARVNALPHSLVWPLGSPQVSFDKQLKEVTTLVGDAAQSLRLAPQLLGSEQPQRYFVMIQQDGEARGTGGLIGGYAIVTAVHGKVTVEKQGTDHTLPDSYAPPGKDLPASFVSSYAPVGTFNLWPAVNESPDLPTVAKVIRDRWTSEGGKPITGAIALDARALSLLLKGGAPLHLGDGKTVAPDDLESYLAVQQYADTTDRATRQDKLTAVATVALDRLTHGGGDTQALLDGVVEAVRSGHLRIASLQPGLAGELQTSGVDGGLPRGPAPVAYAVLNNASGNKLDYFVDRSISYSGGSCSGSRRRTTISVTLLSHAPAVGTLPPYTTFNRATAAGVIHTSTGVDYVQIYATRGARLVSAELNGRPVQSSTLDSTVEDGLPFWAMNVPLPPGQAETFTVHLDEPVTKGAPRIPVQPQTRALKRTVTLPTC